MGEVDFVVENDMDILPIEVKSGKNYKNHAALNHMMENYNLKRAFVLSPYNLETTEKIIYLPIYMTGLLCEKQEDEDVLNISSL